MSEVEPSMTLHLNGREHEATPRNTALYHHIGEAALYNHVYTFMEQDRNPLTGDIIEPNRRRRVGAYIFQRLMPDAYADMSQYMAENNYPAHINLLEAAEVDIKAFDAHVHAMAEDELEGGVPEDWN